MEIKKFKLKTQIAALKKPSNSALWPAIFEGKSALTANQKEEN